jgi:hypothetical protein
MTLVRSGPSGHTAPAPSGFFPSVLLIGAGFEPCLERYSPPSASRNAVEDDKILSHHAGCSLILPNWPLSENPVHLAENPTRKVAGHCYRAASGAGLSVRDADYSRLDILDECTGEFSASRRDPS